VINGETCSADIVRVEPGTYSVLINGQSIEATADCDQIWIDGVSLTVERIDPRRWSQGQAAGADHGTVTIKAAMPGKVIEILAQPGQMIETGQGLLVVEAMKMQNEVKSPKAGTVQSVEVGAGDSVTAGQPLVVVE
jgi:biotin carboxyl carrier protein